MLMMQLPILVNRDNPLPREVDEAGLVVFSNAGFSIMLEAGAARMLSMLLDDIGGWRHIAAVSGYRSRGEQQRLYQQALAEHGDEFTRKYVALPGHSEHETGLAVDVALITDDIDELTPHFPYDGICQRFREAAPNFGFIQRYPAGAENITGIGHEPWHFRYVGLPHSLNITASGIVLEDYK